MQGQLFDALHRAGHVHYLGMFASDPDSSEERRQFFQGLTQALYIEDETAFLEVLPSLRQQFKSLCKKKPDHIPIVLSNEHFVLCQWSTKVRGERIIASRSASRLALVFEGADTQLLAAVRRQDALLRSFFLQHVVLPNHAHREQYASLESYLEDCLDSESLQHGFYDFHETISAYQRAFPEAEVLVWTFEDFCEGQVDVLLQIVKFLGVGSRIPACVRTPLQRLNERSNSGREAISPQWSPLHYAIHRHQALLGVLRRVLPDSVFRRASAALKQQRVIRPLEAEETAKILAEFHGSNTNLARALPMLSKSLLEQGYLKTQNGGSMASGQSASMLAE